jgi:hypothetical protein
MEHLQPVPVSTQQARAEAEAAFHEYLTQSRSGDAPPLSSFLDKYSPLVRAELERLIEDYLILRSTPGLLMVAPSAGTELGLCWSGSWGAGAWDKFGKPSSACRGVRWR